MINQLVKVIKKNRFTFVEMLAYIKEFKKYDDVTYRDLDKAFSISRV